jgi:uncharacterized protein (UPF0548 family)
VKHNLSKSINPISSKASVSKTLNYEELGSTKSVLPAGYEYLFASRRVGYGQDLFEECSKTVLSWGIQSGAGFRVAHRNPVQADQENYLGLHFGLFRTAAPCRVVYVIDEPNRKGFAYGTVQGHPESGEESFIVEIKPDGSVVFEIRAFSRPARWFARLGFLFIRFLQQHVTWKYLDAIHEPVLKRNFVLAATKRSYRSPNGEATVKTGSPKMHSLFEKQ